MLFVGDEICQMATLGWISWWMLPPLLLLLLLLLHQALVETTDVSRFVIISAFSTASRTTMTTTTEAWRMTAISHFHLIDGICAQNKPFHCLLSLWLYQRASSPISQSISAHLTLHDSPSPPAPSPMHEAAHWPRSLDFIIITIWRTTAKITRNHLDLEQVLKFNKLWLH